MHFKKAGKRVFNVKLGDKVVVERLDIVKSVGPLAALEEYVEFEFKNNMILFNGELCNNAYDVRTNKLLIEFEKIGIDNPLINGIVLYAGEKSGIKLFYKNLNFISFIKYLDRN